LPPVHPSKKSRILCCHRAGDDRIAVRVFVGLRIAVGLHYIKDTAGSLVSTISAAEAVGIATVNRSEVIGNGLAVEVDI
jgi:hypothetical protein